MVRGDFAFEPTFFVAVNLVNVTLAH